MPGPLPAGTPIGDAVRNARLALLKRGNPLGLVYVPFALPNLRLVRSSPDLDDLDSDDLLDDPDADGLDADDLLSDGG